MRRTFGLGFLFAAIGCGCAQLPGRSPSGKGYVYTPPEVVKKDGPAIPTRAILFPFRDATTETTQIQQNKITINYLKDGYEKIPRIDGETLARNWGAFLKKSGTFKGVGYAFGDDQDRRGRIGLGGSVVQAQYLIEDPVCLLRIRAVFEARRSGEEKSFWREDLFESGKCDVDPKNAYKQHEALNTMFHALFAKALKSLEEGIETSGMTFENEGIASPKEDESKAGKGKNPSPKKKPIANDSVVDELYRQALEAQ